MPITVTVPPVGAIGPGYLVTVHTTLPGPFDPEIDHWDFEVITTEAGTTGHWSGSIPCTGQTQILDFSELSPIANADTIAANQAVRFRINLIEELVGDLDTPFDETGWQFDPTTNLAEVVRYRTDRSRGQSGLTEEQAVQLAGTAETNVVSALTDALLLTELTNGPTGLPVVAQIASVTFGVIVRLFSIPSDLEPQTPDRQYWVKTLATVRVFRGNDLWFRVPIHTPTKIVPFEKEGLVVWVANVTLTTWLLNIQLIVDFLPGVTGQVYLMHFP